MTRLLVLSLGAALAVAGSAAPAQMMPNDLKWGAAPAALPAGAQIAVLSGDPTKEGMFTIRLKFPAGYSVPAHHHPTPELVTVMEGQLSLGMGDKLDKAKAAALGVGGYVVAPATMNHFAFTDGGATVQITSHGPFEVVYVDPADDPRGAAKAAEAAAPAAADEPAADEPADGGE
ncbi:MAG TPA: cupin domain-containing protein [Sphingomicrobium sp.]|nr:cupin domain-containing protein [Sphingomicrobium sp.]